MPTIVNKQVAKPLVLPTTPVSMPSSLLSEFIDAKDIRDDYLRFCIYGTNRVGKTTLACQFEKPLALISFEPATSGGAKSIKLVDGVKYCKILSSRAALEMAEKLRTDKYFKTIVLDGATSLQDLILSELLGKPLPTMLSWGLISEDQYRQRSEKCREALRPFLDLPKDVIVLAKEKDHNKIQGERGKPKILNALQVESHFASDLGAATVGWLHDACDYIARLYVDFETKTVETELDLGDGNKLKSKEEVRTGKMVHRLRTMYHVHYAAGFRSCNPECVPEYVEGPSSKEMYENVMKIIHGEYVVTKKSE